jgi:hypothetical protein
MAGFITARDGLATVMQTITSSASGHLKATYKYDRRFQTDATGDGYPYCTVSPSFDKSTEAYRWTRANEASYAITVRLFGLVDGTETTETAFLTLLDLALTTLRSNANIRLGGTVQDCLITNVKLGYNDDSQPTMRVAEIECAVRQIISRF